MRTIRWFVVICLVLGCAMLTTTGCRGKRGSRQGATGTDNIGGVVGSDIGETSLSSRPAGDLDIITTVKFDTVLFDYDSAQIVQSERVKVDAVADYLKKNSGVAAIAEGNCDERGSREYNMALGERRALAVRAYLVGLGIDGSLIQTKSYGKEKPIDPGHDENAWRVNRRVEFVLYRVK